MMRTTALCASLVLALALGACSTTQPAGTQVDDAWITTKVESKLAADPQVSALNVNVNTNEGVVTLTGRVKSEENRREAVKLARDTEGVKEVRDLLEVGDLN